MSYRVYGIAGDHRGTHDGDTPAEAVASALNTLDHPDADYEAEAVDTHRVQIQEPGSGVGIHDAFDQDAEPPAPRERVEVVAKQ